MVIVHIALALICFQSGCYPVLVGNDTQVGEYELMPRIVLSEGYGGDVLEYKEDATTVYAIHRIWLGNPNENRLARIQDPNPKMHVITHGCINVLPEVYDKLKDCCSNDHLSIVP